VPNQLYVSDFDQIKCPIKVASLFTYIRISCVNILVEVDHWISYSLPWWQLMLMWA